MSILQMGIKSNLRYVLTIRSDLCPALSAGFIADATLGAYILASSDMISIVYESRYALKTRAGSSQIIR
jgi:hypothetical protein